MEEQFYSRSNIDLNSKMPLNRANKRKMVMSANVEASKRILASKSLRKKEDEENYLNMHKEVAEMKDLSKVDPALQVEELERRIGLVKKKIKTIEDVKIKNNGFLRRGQEEKLKQFKIAVDRLCSEKEGILTKSKKVEDFENPFKEDMTDGREGHSKH